jgi:hypothetical protein
LAIVGGGKEAGDKIKHSRVPILGQPSRLWVWVGDGHLDLEENCRDAVARKPTVGSEEVHANRPSSSNVATTPLCSDTFNWIRHYAQDEETTKITALE